MMCLEQPRESCPSAFLLVLNLIAESFVIMQPYSQRGPIRARWDPDITLHSPFDTGIGSLVLRSRTPVRSVPISLAT